VLKKSSSTVTLVPPRQRRRRDRRYGAAFDLDAPGMRLASGARGERHARHGGDRCERLAAKSQRRDGLEDPSAADLGRRVVARRQRQASRAMPAPSSTTRMRLVPPAARSTSTCVEPASSAFSSSSFSAAAGSLDDLARRRSG
jgi:hypothetical protein